MIKKVILFNGPKESGKDTVGEHLAELIPNSKIFMFKNTLYKWAATVSTLSLDEIIYISSDRVLKELPNSSLPFNRTTRKHFTPREWLIHVSENVIKPLAGNDYFGYECANEIEESGVEVALITDSGFDTELAALKDGLTHFKLVGTCTCPDITLVRIHRPGYTFKGDSRNYLDDEILKILNVPVIDIHNDSDLETFLKRAEYLAC